MIERIGTEFRERHKMSDFYKKFIIRSGPGKNLFKAIGQLSIVDLK